MQQTLFLMLGYPGAGKTTAAKIISKITGAELLSSDETRAQLFPNSQFTQEEHDELYKVLNNKTQEQLAQGKSVVYDANLNRYEHRHEKYQFCQAHNVKSVLVWVQTDKTLAKERAAHESREHLWPPNETPEAMFDRIANILEPPRDNEAHITIDGTKVNEEYVRLQFSAAGVL